MLRRHVVPTRRLDSESLAEDRDQRLGLHRPDARQAEEPSLEVAAVLRLGPDAARVTTIVIGNRGRYRLHATRHRAGEPMQRGPTAEHFLELRGIHRRDPRRVQMADSPLQLERPRERLLDGDLLVEREANEERQRVTGEKRIGLVVAGERQPCWRCGGGRHCHVGMVHVVPLGQRETPEHTRSNRRTGMDCCPPEG